MDKLQRYNQKLLAIIGTFILVFAALMLLGVIGGMIFELVGNSSSNDYDNAITIEENAADSDSTKTKFRDQAISFTQPVLIDTLKQTYLVAVSQVNLHERDEINQHEPLAIKKMTSGSGSRNYRRFDRTGNYNNLVIHDGKTGEQKAVFNRRINITEFFNTVIKDQHLLFVYGSFEDSNRDRKLDEDDLSALFIYNIDSEQLNEISFERMSVYSTYTMIDSTSLVLKMRYDKNNDGEIDSWKEPIIIKQLSLADFTSEEFVNPELKAKLQALID